MTAGHQRPNTSKLFARAGQLTRCFSQSSRTRHNTIISHLRCNCLSFRYCVGPMRVTWQVKSSQESQNYNTHNKTHSEANYKSMTIAPRLYMELCCLGNEGRKISACGSNTYTHTDISWDQMTIVEWVTSIVQHISQFYNYQVIICTCKTLLLMYKIS